MRTHPKPTSSWLRESLATAILGLAALCAQAQVVDLAGAKFEPTAELGGQTLVLNGAAIRYKAIFKVYAVGLYLPTKTSVAKDVLTSNAPRRVQMTMLREVGGVELGRNFTGHFKDNATPEEVKGSIPQLFRWENCLPHAKWCGRARCLPWIGCRGRAQWFH